VLLEINFYKEEFRELKRVCGSNLDVVIADAHSLPLREGALETALLWNVLMFLSEDKKAVREAARVLRDYGIVLVSVYNVQSGSRNYNLEGLLRLLLPHFTILHSENHSYKQVKIIAAKKTSTRYATLRISAATLVKVLNQVGVKLHTDGLNLSGEAIVLIPRDSSREGDRAAVKWIYRTNLVSFAILGEFVKQGLFKRIVSQLSERLGSKCMHSPDEVYRTLLELGLNKIYAEKFANDLMRLGIFTNARGSPVASTLCNYMPSYRAATALRHTPRIVGCSATQASCVAELLMRYNPIMRRVASSLSGYTDVNLEVFRDTLRRELASYLTQCHRVLELERHREYKMLGETSYIVERVIEPLSALSILSWSQKAKRMHFLVTVTPL
jgi:hypothetical protein